jgi:hypothetical protein
VTSQLYSSGLPTSSTESPLAALVPLPHAEAMRHENAAYDAVVNAFGKRTYRERKRELEAVFKSYESPPPGLVAAVPSRLALIIMLPSLENTAKQMARTAVERRLTQIVWALTAYHAEKGEYPTLLDQLAPKYLREVPNDPFTEAAFPYERTAGGYQLRSDGANMADDKGPATLPADDINAGTE